MGGLRLPGFHGGHPFLVPTGIDVSQLRWTNHRAGRKLHVYEALTFAAENIYCEHIPCVIMFFAFVVVVALQRWLKPGGKLFITDYCCKQCECGDDCWSPSFESYVRKRCYHLISVDEYAEVSRSFVAFYNDYDDELHSKFKSCSGMAVPWCIAAWWASCWLIRGSKLTHPLTSSVEQRGWWRDSVALIQLADWSSEV